MIAVSTRRNQQLAVFGLSASGLAAARALRDGGAEVLAWDDDPSKRDAAAAEGIAVADPAALDWRAFGGLVLSPGVPLTHPAPHPVVDLARSAACPIIGDIELLAEACPQATFVGVTGTNGKSTTTSLVGHVLAATGRKIAVGGNLGPPALGLERLDADGVYVLELSSYQLDLTAEARFDVAVFLNLTPDHLDRHGDMAGYFAAKRRIFRDRETASARPAQVAVVGVDDEYGVRLAHEMAGRRGWRTIPVSSARRLDRGVYALDGDLFDALEASVAKPACRLADIPALPGQHNWQNAAAAWAAARALGVGRRSIASALASFPGLAHRQELVGTINGIRYVNDSKATNAEATARAVGSYDNVYLIAGGLPKETGLDALRPHTGRLRHVFLIGDAAARFESELDGRASATRSGTLEAALRAAHRLAQSERVPGAVVLLSPACASFDQWRDFEARGDAFRQKVRLLLSEEGE